MNDYFIYSFNMPLLDRQGNTPPGLILWYEYPGEKHTKAH